VLGKSVVAKLDADKGDLIARSTLINNVPVRVIAMSSPKDANARRR
jgi:hypothetical protein